jgi:hypothetical protein
MVGAKKHQIGEIAGSAYPHLSKLSNSKIKENFQKGYYKTKLEMTASGGYRLSIDYPTIPIQPKEEKTQENDAYIFSYSSSDSICDCCDCCDC